MYHYRTTRNTYKKHNNSDKQITTCTFCREIEKADKILHEGKTMFVLPNRVSYDVFEGRHVTDHIMVIPKRHIDSINDFTSEEASEFVQLIGWYESEGYNVYARGRGNISRSVQHQHTHLIKTDDKPTKALLFVKKPYFLIKL